MNDLVINHKGTLATTQSIVSELTDNNEQSVQKLIRTYEADLKEFGKLEFSNIQIQAGLGLTYKKVYCLNEQQATLLLTYMKNTPKVREAKKILVKAFYEMKQELQALKLQTYVNQISALEANNRLEAKHHQDQINGYLGKLAVVNKANEVLKAELIVARSKSNNQDQIQRLEAMLHNTRLDRDFYMKRYHELQKTTKAKEHKAVLAIDAIQSKMEQVFTAMGAVKTYIHDGDEYFLNNNSLIKEHR